MAEKERNTVAGFSIVEMVVTMTIMLVIMGLVMTMFARSFSTRTRESSRTDALTATQAALNVMSREIANSGYALVTNGLMNGSNDQLLHYNANHINTDDLLNGPGEDVTYYWEPTTQSILRHDANGLGPGNPQTSVIINRISRVQFQYFDYLGANPIPTGPNTTPTANTGRVRITLTVNMENVFNQVNPDAVVLTSDVTLRNSDYMLKNY
jgi:type II secretory pathway pseudopilin PulG